MNLGGKRVTVRNRLAALRPNQSITEAAQWVYDTCLLFGVPVSVSLRCCAEFAQAMEKAQEAEG